MTFGILTGKQIDSAVKSGDIQISPYTPSFINPASIDLTLGKGIAVYSAVTEVDFGGNRFEGENLRPKTGPNAYLDSAQKNEIERYEMSGLGFLLKPGISYLMHTEERVRTDKYVPIIDGKSSIGRLFLFVHVTAGYGDPGFDGQYTLEVVVVNPVVVYPGMQFCQMRFHTTVGEHVSYKETGNYRGELAMGPVPSQSYKLFPF